ncbi:uncharacterized protein PHACADRAFT_150961 [Phanerochaete carnosa HHB-10118-sp]|uniref:Uncharacterized protein n=1 Tax=Phanerochaete carnosa (strain HHB-10118-sp) TaxID=650164 RepID=K5VZJ3_PHACS|nr:uncharacterized protein PHACADRAFT_150961 [Phanerochaete carnosa HHB-10118-sp]EKM52039.1 hypothetical protein PHACADRAFT_150961 [Phanerochaete carnosa HHB-10118-sp]
MPSKTKKRSPTPVVWNNPEMAFAADISRQGPRLTIPAFEAVEERMLWAYSARGLDRKAFELKVVAKRPKLRRHCSVCRRDCNGDDKTLQRHIRTQSHLTNLANCLWVEYDSLLGEDIVEVCDRCGEGIMGTRGDSLHRHQVGPCKKKDLADGNAKIERPIHPLPRSKAPSVPPLQPEPQTLHHQPPEPEDDEDEQPPRKIARRSIDTEVASERRCARSQSKSLEDSSSSLPSLTPTPEPEQASSSDENDDVSDKQHEDSPAPAPPRTFTPSPAPLPGPSTPSRSRIQYGSTRVDSPPPDEPSTLSRRSSVSSGKSSEVEHDVGGTPQRSYHPFDIAPSDEEGNLKLLASAASTRAPRIPPSSPYDPDTYEPRWRAEPPASPLEKRAIRRTFFNMRPAPFVLPSLSAMHSPAVVRCPRRTPSPPPAEHYW